MQADKQINWKIKKELFTVSLLLFGIINRRFVCICLRNNKNKKPMKNAGLCCGKLVSLVTTGIVQIILALNFWKKWKEKKMQCV